jgi:oligoendopeptidase F
LALQLAPPKWVFLPAALDAGSLPALEPFFRELQQRTLPDVAAVERWLLDESELSARISAELARRYIRMTCHTEDAAAKAAYLAMEQEVVPHVKVLSDQLDKKLLACPAASALDPQRFHVLMRRRRAQSEIFREANTDLQRQEAELQTRQQELMGSLTVEFDGRTLTLQQLAPFFESQDRELRERAYRASLAVRRPTWPELEDLFDRLGELRTRMARNAGFATYTPYRFLDLGRFDYGPEQCFAFHRAVEECVVPAVRELDRERVRRLGLTTLRPWDLEVDPSGRGPQRPFTSEPELITLVRRIFAQVDPRFTEEFDVLVERGQLDLMSRKGKAPGGYQYTLEDERLPFIFANGVGVHQDVQTLLHEGGHAFHAILARDHDLLAYRDSPIEFAETASMSMELLGLEHLDAVYANDDSKAAYRKHLEGVLRVLPWIASIDAFQHWVYGNPGHTREQRQQAWLDIRARFEPDVDYTGIEDARAHQWTRQPHLFVHPFYYVEYGIAQLAALQVWANYRRDAKAAVAAYRRALALGGSRPLPELFAAANVTFDLSPAKLRLLVADVLARMR